MHKKKQRKEAKTHKENNTWNKTPDMDDMHIKHADIDVVSNSTTSSLSLPLQPPSLLDIWIYIHLPQSHNASHFWSALL